MCVETRTLTITVFLFKIRQASLFRKRIELNIQKLHIRSGA